MLLLFLVHVHNILAACVIEFMKWDCPLWTIPGYTPRTSKDQPWSVLSSESLGRIEFSSSMKIDLAWGGYFRVSLNVFWRVCNVNRAFLGTQFQNFPPAACFQITGRVRWAGRVRCATRTFSKHLNSRVRWATQIGRVRCAISVLVLVGCW